MIISKSEYPEQAIENMMKTTGPEGKYINREYEIMAGENGLHGDDDHETIIDLMVQDIDVAEGNAYAHAVRKAKMDGKKKGDKVMGPDGKEITIANCYRLRAFNV